MGAISRLFVSACGFNPCKQLMTVPVASNANNQLLHLQILVSDSKKGQEKVPNGTRLLILCIGFGTYAFNWHLPKS